MVLPKKKEFIERLNSQSGTKKKPEYAALLKECIDEYRTIINTPATPPKHVSRPYSSPPPARASGDNFCSNCGTRKDSVARFCANCGTQYGTSQYADDPSYPSYTYYAPSQGHASTQRSEVPASISSEFLLNGILDLIGGVALAVVSAVYMSVYQRSGIISRFNIPPILGGRALTTFNAPDALRSGAFMYWLMILGVIAVAVGISNIIYRKDATKVGIIVAEYAILLIASLIFIFTIGLEVASWLGGFAWLFIFIGPLSVLGGAVPVGKLYMHKHNKTSSLR